MHVIPDPVVVQFASVEVESEDHPPGSAAESIARALEFGLPLLIGATCFLDRFKYVAGGLTVAAKIGEVDFVQNERACADEFLALKVAVDVRRQVLVSEHRGESLLDSVKRSDGAAVIVLVMRTDELFRNPFEFGRIER